FKEIADKLYNSAFTDSDAILQDDCSMQAISPCLIFTPETILKNINQDLRTHYTDIYDLSKKIDDDRTARFQALIKHKFSDRVLIALLDLFESRKDDEQINNFVTDNADIPTIFEYILGIIWYKISENKGSILDFMKLSLDANLLPKSHAVGGGADIIYMYDKTKDYPQHTVLLEATLTNKTNQRRAEMEPVSRHLGEYLLAHKNDNSYCVFLTNYLDLNVISDFRGRKEYTYYSADGQSFIKGMKIIPLQVSDIKNILVNNIIYKHLYLIFDNAYHSQKEIRFWYQETISNEILKS
ncbi:MAG: AlwI family type II restriction endonuclease, partial [Endomicrobium sp.]|nr:AlwI family type II restriction endonuclease [Endomicrobium sp.]